MKYIICDTNDCCRGWGGMEFNSKKDFLNEISQMIDECIENGVDGFGITIETVKN